MGYKKNKILLIHPPATIDMKIEGDLKYPPMGITFLTAVAREHGYDIRIFDGNVEKNPLKKLHQLLAEFNPTIIGLSFTSILAQSAHQVAKIVKDLNKNIVVIAGGYHSTVRPVETIKDKNFDFVVVGEGEKTFIAWLDKIENNKNDFDQIKGLVFRRGDEIIQTDRRELIPDLDLLPLPAYDLLPLHCYSSLASTRKPYITFIRSRGCPFECVFCGVQKMFGRQYRCQSPEKTILEIDTIVKKFGVKEINFRDSDFVINKPNVERLCQLLIERNYNLIWTCNTRVDVVDEKILRLMKKAGCRLVAYGVESCVQEILDNLKKKTTVPQIKEAIRITKEVGIIPAVNIIVGGIGETKETLRQTLEIMKELNPDYIAFTYLAALPGSELYEKALENNWFIDEPSRFGFEQLEINATQMSNEELSGALKYAIKSFYFRPKYVLLRLKHLSLGEIKNDFRGLWTIIKNVIFK